MPKTKNRFIRLSIVLAGFIVVLIAGATLARQLAKTIPSAVKTQQQAKHDKSDWGTFYTYYEGETYGTKDMLTGVAVIKPGMEIHPPHQHTEEEYLMVTEGQGAWHLNGKTFAAQKGDILYAAPWDVHGIKNTGAAPLVFVVWKWNNKGLALPAKPPQGNK
jgi:mannose-6-phosphate isomerase-like protein (cupin superfamily)